MSNEPICTKKHRYLEEYSELPQSQDNQSGDRHVCAGCAYEEGLKDGMAGKPPQTDLSHLPRSQAGTVRHRGDKEAYDKGYEEGRRRAT